VIDLTPRMTRDALDCRSVKAEIDFCRGTAKFFSSPRENAMRMMLKFTLPVEKGNAAINDGSLGKAMETIMSKLKPEAAYFAPLDGKRGGMIFFDLAEPSQIVEVVEPLFLKLNATTELVPVMNGDELRKGWGKSRRNSGCARFTTHRAALRSPPTRRPAHPFLAGAAPMDVVQ
jgi:hypothetical protein